MRRRTAITLGLLVPFAIQFVLIVLEKSGGLDWSADVYYVLLGVSALTGFVFLSRGFRPLHIVMIGVVYFPLMIAALVVFGFGVAGWVYGKAL